MFNIEECVAYISSQTAKTIEYRIESKMKDLPITRVQYLALHHLKTHKDLTQKDLVSHMNLKEASVARLLDRMEEQDLVKRCVSLNDRRVHTIAISVKGDYLETHVNILMEQFEKCATQGISEEELEIYFAVMTKILENIKDY